MLGHLGLILGYRGVITGMFEMLSGTVSLKRASRSHAKTGLCWTLLDVKNGIFAREVLNKWREGVPTTVLI